MSSKRHAHQSPFPAQAVPPAQAAAAGVPPIVAVAPVSAPSPTREDAAAAPQASAPEPAPASRPAKGAKVVVLGGMRGAERRACHVSAMLDGMRGVVPVTLLDISVTGALLTIDAPAFTASEAGSQARLHAQLCERHLGTSSTLVLGAERVVILPVRWVSQAGPARRYGMAVRFAEPRTDAQLAEIVARSTPAPQPKAPGAV